MIQILHRSAADEGDVVSTPFPGYAVMRYSGPAHVRHELYTPVLCLVLQGAKQVALGVDVHQVSAGQMVLVNIEVPVTAKVVSSETEPYLAVAFDLDVALLDEVAQFRNEFEAGPPGGAIALIEKPSERLLDCISRIVALAGRAHEVEVLLPGLRRELHYLLLLSVLGPALRVIARPDSHHRRIGRAVALLRSGFHEPLPVETLAHTAGMSASAFHYHFKEVTGLSPRQYQKRLRLLEARRLMRNEGISARQAAFEVGYASPQQFTRDHARQFGAPPRRGLYAESKHTALVE